MANEAQILKPYRIWHHPNADRLDCIQFRGEGGFVCVCGRDQFTLNDLILYIEPDSVITDRIKEHLEKTSNIKVTNRIRAIKLRGVISEGLCLHPKDFIQTSVKEGMDVSGILNIKHYEPPPPKGQGWKNQKGSNPWYQNRQFKKYTHIDRFEKVCGHFKEGENVHISTKYHGMNARYGWCPRDPKTKLDKFLQLLKLRSKWEYLVGSHRTVRNIGKNAKPLPEEMGDKDYFILAGKQYDMERMVKTISEANQNTQVIVYAELVGWGLNSPLQEGYWYGIPKGKVELRVFDILVNGKYLSMASVISLCKSFNVPCVDTLYKGPFDLDLLGLAQAVDEKDNWKGNREGIVIKVQPPQHSPRMGYVVAKKINPDYLVDKNNSEFH
jgi:RNA ligase (TIGR02306 family)